MRPIPAMLRPGAITHCVDPFDNFLVGMRAGGAQIEYFSEKFGAVWIGDLYDFLLAVEKGSLILKTIGCLSHFESLICQFNLTADHTRQDIRDFRLGGV